MKLNSYPHEEISNITASLSFEFRKKLSKMRDSALYAESKGESLIISDTETYAKELFNLVKMIDAFTNYIKTGEVSECLTNKR